MPEIIDFAKYREYQDPVGSEEHFMERQVDVPMLIFETINSLDPEMTNDELLSIVEDYQHSVMIGIPEDAAARSAFKRIQRFMP